MGTYTTNYNLFMPSVGETGWGTLVNTNFSTIDTTMKGLSNRITSVENEVNGNLSCTSVTTSGKITGNGGIAGTTGTFSGAVTGASFNGVVFKNSGTITVTPSNNNQFYKFQKASEGGLLILPPVGTVLYTGQIRIKNLSTDGYEFYVDDGINGTVGGGFPNSGGYIYANSIFTYTFSNIPYLQIKAPYIYMFGYEPVILS